jgi:ribose 5-phosphate isomerase B
MKIGIGADHRGFKLKTRLKEYLLSNGNKVIDFGPDSEAPVDYPEIAIRVAKAVANKKIKFGILSCFSGQGMAIAANKVPGIRAAICTDKELAYYARAHNNANILVLPSRSIKRKNQWKPSLIRNLRVAGTSGGWIL